jgi:hypothetical protein
MGDMRISAMLLPLSSVVLSSLVACQGYRAGSFRGDTGEFVGAHRTVGCVDVSVASLRDPEARGPAARFSFGNRCDAATALDLSAVRVVARYADGERATVRPYDPGRVIRQGLLEARTTGTESIEYQSPRRGVRVVELCMDLAGIDANEPSPRPVVVCLPAPEPSRSAYAGVSR